MTEIGDEVEPSLKSIYGEKWREALFVHLLIGLGRNSMERNRDLGSRDKEGIARRRRADEPDGKVVRELHENPLGHVRQMNEKLADELETQLHRIRKGPVKDDHECVFPDLGELIEAIGIHALTRLERSNYDVRLSEIMECVIQVSWDEASPSVREDTLRIMRLLTFFSSEI